MLEDQQKVISSDLLMESIPRRSVGSNVSEERIGLELTTAPKSAA